MCSADLLPVELRKPEATPGNLGRKLLGAEAPHYRPLAVDHDGPTRRTSIHIAGARGVHRCQLRQSRYASAALPRLAEVHLRQLGCYVVTPAGRGDEFVKRHSYVHAVRMGIWGQSGGASASLNLMFRYPGRFLAGVAMSPCPTRRFTTPSTYQKRYMGLPADNPKGYHNGSPINFAEGLTGHLLIIHRSGDDNVHLQATELLVNKLIELGKPFDMDYPNRTHELGEGPGTLYHLYTLFPRYMEEHVSPGPTGP